MKKIVNLVLLFTFITTAIVSAKSAFFTIKVGTFLNPKMTDFETIRSIGYVYGTKAEGELYEIFMGKYADQASAEQAAVSLKNQGFFDAKVEERSLEEGKLVTVIQLTAQNYKSDINWEKYVPVGHLHTILNGDKVKIVAGPYTDTNAAKKQLNKVRKQGFSDAFIKNVNSVFLHKVSSFEMNGLKQALIPLAFDDNKPTRITPTDTPPQKVEPTPPTLSDPMVIAERKVDDGNIPTTHALNPQPLTDFTTPNLPAIRSNVKRRSVLNLQTTLKGEGVYNSSLDGLYGKGTAAAYDKARKTNRQLQKYRVLAPYMDFSGRGVNESQLQKAINMLTEDPYNASGILEKSKNPTAKAYRAYSSFVSKGASAEVNGLMNLAIREAYKKPAAAASAPFDHTATYAYQDLNQLLLHLTYVQAVSPEALAAPCWIFQQHPQAARAIFLSGNTNLPIQNCGGFEAWEEIQILQTIAADLNADKKFDATRLSQDVSLRTKLFLTPSGTPNARKEQLENWNEKMLRGLDTWSSRDPLNQQLVQAYKLAYFQSQVLLEDYYMDKGFNVDEAKGLSLEVLRTLVAYHTERFM